MREQRQIPDVHANDREIPPGKVLIAECGTVPANERARYDVLREKISDRGDTVKLIAKHAGWVVAGSVLRWENGAFVLRLERDGTSYSRPYRTLREAEAVFDSFPEKQTS